MNAFSSKRGSDSCSDNPKSNMQKRPRGLKLARLVAFVVALTMCGAVAHSQQPSKISRLGWLTASSLAAQATRIEAFRQGLRDLGYVEGKNVAIELRSADGKLDRLTALVAELVQLKVDIVVSAGPAATRAVKQTTSSIPVVMTNETDPIASGFVASLARPGGNVTGLSTHSPELSGKQLEILKETVPKLSRVAVLETATDPGNAQSLKELELAAAALKLKLQYLDLRDHKDIEPAFQGAIKEHAEACLVLLNPITGARRSQILELMVKHRLPATYPNSPYVEAGGLMTYSTSVVDLDRRAATYVDKILKGAKPADLPVEQPKKFEFVINLKAARQIGLTIPPNVLARADRVIR